MIRKPPTKHTYTRQTAVVNVTQHPLKGLAPGNICWWARVIYFKEPLERLGDETRIYEQVGSYDSQKEAEEAGEWYKATGQKMKARKDIHRTRNGRIWKTATSKGVDVWVVTASTGANASGKRSRIRIGAFGTIGEAEAAKKKYDLTGEVSTGGKMVGRPPRKPRPVKPPRVKKEKPVKAPKPPKPPKPPKVKKERRPPAIRRTREVKQVEKYVKVAGRPGYIPKPVKPVPKLKREKPEYGAVNRFGHIMSPERDAIERRRVLLIIESSARVRAMNGDSLEDEFERAQAKWLAIEEAA